MSDVYVVWEEEMDDGYLAYGFHRVKIIESESWIFGHCWKCRDCGKEWMLHPNCFYQMREDESCST